MTLRSAATIALAHQAADAHCKRDWECACGTCNQIRLALNNMKPSKAERVTEAINATRGRFFSVTFTKRTDGTTRRMIARTGVRKGVTGEGMAYKPRERGLIVVWSADRQQFRMIPAENVISITFRGKEVRFQ